MGHALALVYALGGHTVRVTDSSPDVLARSMSAMQTALAILREGGEVDASWTDARLGMAVTRCPALAETLDQAELIVEAISEQPEAKRALYAEIDALRTDRCNPGLQHLGAGHLSAGAGAAKAAHRDRALVFAAVSGRSVRHRRQRAHRSRR